MIPNLRPDIEVVEFCVELTEASTTGGSGHSRRRASLEAFCHDLYSFA